MWTCNIPSVAVTSLQILKITSTSCCKFNTNLRSSDSDWFIFIYVYVCACMRLWTLHVCRSTQRPEKSFVPLGLELQAVVRPSCRCWELNPNSLQEHAMLITIEPSLHPPKTYFINSLFISMSEVLGSKFTTTKKKERKKTHMRDKPKLKIWISSINKWHF